MTAKTVGLGMSDFSWASACQYLVYVEASAGLVPVSSNQIYNFPYAQLGPQKLIATKKRCKKTLEGNLSRLESWVGGRGDVGMDDSEKVVVRTLYRSIKSVLEIVDDHLALAERLVASGQLSVFDAGGETDEPLF